MTSMFPRLLRPPKGSFFLLGPRGSGKTTWLDHHFATAPRFDLLDEARYQRYLADITELQRELELVPPASWVVVDEVQRLPSLLNEVHRQIERRRIKFALTGSSARKLRRGGVNLLGGRAVWRTMFPLAPAELGRAFSLERALRIGSLPIVWTADDPEETLEAYVRLYLKEEVQAEALLRSLAGFARFLPIAALFHGQVLNASSLARDAGVARTTVLGYLSILEDTLLATTLPAFEARLRVRERKHPKLYWIDPGLVRALKRARGPVLPEERGPLLEGFVLTLLRLYAELKRLPLDALGYWAPAEARTTEVDFILSSGRERTAIEVKSTRRVRDADLRGLRAIADLPGLKRRMLVCLAPADGRTHDGIAILRIDGFLERLDAGMLLER
jgi:predicted AAA+ superfamily ATPase